MRRALAPLLALLALAPFAASHAVPADFTVEPFAEPLPFDGEARTLVTFDYRCGGMSTGESEANMSVRFEVLDAPAWARLAVEPAELALPECRGVGRATATLVGSAARNASGPMPGEAILVARWATSGFVLNETASVRVQSAWTGAFRVEAPVREQVAKPQTPVVFPLTLTNDGTGVTKFLFEVVSKSESLQVPIPNPVTLQAQGGQNVAKIPLTVQTPYRNGPMDEAGEVTIRITPQAALDPLEKGAPQELTFRVQTKGFYVPAPPFGALLALAAAGLLLRRAR